MPILQFQTEIPASPERVFSYVSDLENHVEWSGGSQTTKTSAGPVQVGTTYETLEAGPFGRTLKETSKVIDYRPNGSFAWRSYGPMGSWFDWSFEVRIQDSGTLLVQRLDRSHGLVAAVGLKLVFQRQMAKSMPEGLLKIAGHLAEH